MQLVFLNSVCTFQERNSKKWHLISCVCCCCACECDVHQQMASWHCQVKDVNGEKKCIKPAMLDSTTRVFALEELNSTSPMSTFSYFKVIRRPGVDSGGLLQRACAAAAGMGDVRLPHHLLHVFRLPRSPHHWPRRPYQHRLELLGKFQAGPSAIGCAWICTRHLFFSCVW